MATKKHKSVAEFGAKDNASRVVTAYAERVQKQLNKMGSNFEKNSKGIRRDTKKISKSAEQLGNSLKLVGTSVLGYFSASTISAFTTKSIDAFKNQEEAVIKFNLALRNAGVYTGEVSQKLQAFASEVQGVSRFGDEEILPMVQRFIQMGQSVDQAKESVRALVGLATSRGFQSLEQGMEQYLTASTGSIEAMNKLGIDIDKNASKTERFSQLNQQLLSKYEGMSEILSKLTTTGQMQQGAMAVGDMFEKIGGALTGSGAAIGATDLLTRLAKLSDRSFGDLSQVPITLSEINKQIDKWEKRRELSQASNEQSAIASIPFFGALASSLTKHGIETRIQDLTDTLLKETDRARRRLMQGPGDRTSLEPTMIGTAEKSVNDFWEKVYKKDGKDTDPMYNLQHSLMKATEYLPIITDQMRQMYIQAQLIGETNFVQRMNGWDVSTLPSIPEVLDPGDATGDVIKKMEDLAYAQEMQYRTRQQMASAAGAMASKFLGAESKIVKAIAVWQMGLEVAEASKAAAKHQWWEASQHALAATQFAQVAGQSGGGSAGRGGGMQYDPYQRPTNDNNVTVVNHLVANFDENGFNTSVENTVSDNIRNQGRLLDQIRKAL